jgi:hypothetical protein
MVRPSRPVRPRRRRHCLSLQRLRCRQRRRDRESGRQMLP